MNVAFTKEGLEDYEFWKATDAKKLERLHALLNAIASSPFQGIGKPEPLKHSLTGCWSRRIDSKNRLVYKIGDGSKILVLQARFHY